MLRAKEAMTEMPTNPNAHEEQNISHLFKEHDDVGPESSLWLRIPRQLLQHGKPVGATVVLAIQGPQHGYYPFGAFAVTKRNRLIFWPVLPQDAKMTAPVENIDHITFELPSGKTHITAYDHNRKPVPYRRRWRLQLFPESGLSLWFILFVKTDVLFTQELGVQRAVSVPVNDRARRVDAALNYVQTLRVQDLQLPPEVRCPSYIYVAVYVANQGSCAPNLLASMFPHCLRR